MQGNTGYDSNKKIMKNKLTFVRLGAGYQIPVTSCRENQGLVTSCQ